MTHTQFLGHLGAPLAGIYNWGSIREGDGAIFLLLWQDRVAKIRNSQFVKMTDHGKFQNDKRFGAKERLEHVDLILAGATCYIVMCIPKDKNAYPRLVDDYINDAVFLGGEMVEHENEWWIRLGRRIPIAEIRQ